MYLRHSANLVSFGLKNHNLLKFSNNYILHKKISILLPIRYTATIETQVSSDFTEKRRSNRIPYFGQYLINNTDKYGILKTEDIELMKENFESLKLLNKFVSSEHDDPSEDEIPMELEKIIESEIKDYSLEDFLKFIVLMSKLNISCSRLRLGYILSTELCKRNFSVDERLQIMFIIKMCWGNLSYARKFHFTLKSMMRLCSKMKRLTSNQMVILFYSMVKLNSEKLRPFKYDLQMKIIEILPQLNCTELGIVARGYSQFDIVVNKALFLALIEKTLNEIENIDDMSLHAMCKLISVGAHFSVMNDISDFQEKLIPYVSNFNVSNIISLMIVGLKERFVNPTLWELLIKKFKEDLIEKPESIKLQQIESIAHYTVVFNKQEDEVLKQLVEKLEPQKISTKYKFLISFLYYLIHHQLYPEKLLRLILSKHFRSLRNLDVLTVKERYKYCYINSCVEFENPTNNYELFDTREKEKFYQIFKIWPKVDSYSRSSLRSTTNMFFTIQGICGEGTACLTKLFPHGFNGIVMRFDKNLEPQKIPEEFTLSDNSIKKPLVDDHFWAYIVLLSNFNFLWGFESLTLEAQTQIRQTTALGYIPLVVEDVKWIQQLKKGTQKDYINDEIIKNLKELVGKKSQ